MKKIFIYGVVHLIPEDARDIISYFKNKDINHIGIEMVTIHESPRILFEKAMIVQSEYLKKKISVKKYISYLQTLKIAHTEGIHKDFYHTLLKEVYAHNYSIYGYDMHINESSLNRSQISIQNLASQKNQNMSVENEIAYCSKMLKLSVSANTNREWCMVGNILSLLEKNTNIDNLGVFIGASHVDSITAKLYQCGAEVISDVSVRGRKYINNNDNARNRYIYLQDNASFERAILEFVLLNRLKLPYKNIFFINIEEIMHLNNFLKNNIYQLSEEELNEKVYSGFVPIFQKKQTVYSFVKKSS